MVCFCGRREPGLGPAADSLSLASPRESKQREGDPAVCDPCAALRGNLRRGVCGVRRGTRYALHSDNHGESDVEACVSCGTHATPQTPRHRRIQMGRCTTGLCFARPRADEARQRARPGGPSVAMARDHPVEAGPRSAGFGGSGIALFERSEFSETPPNSSTAGCPERSAGTQTAGRLSFGYFSLAKQRRSTSPAGARPGLRPHRRARQ